MPGKKGPSQKAVDELVASYLLDAVREHAGEDEYLLDKVLALHELTTQREHASDMAKRFDDVRGNPLIRGAVAAMGDRVQRLVNVGIKVAEDTQVLRKRLHERLTARDLNPADDDEYEECVLEYERVLADTIPLPTALTNIEAVADLVELGNDVLHSGSGLKRHLYEMGWNTFKRMIFKDEKVLARIEELKSDVEADPNRLKRIAKLIRKEAPAVVKDAYARAEAYAADEDAAKKSLQASKRKKAARKKS